MSLWLCFLPWLSLSHALTAATWFMKVPILWDEGWEGGRTVCAGQSSGITMDELCCYTNIYSSPSPSPLFSVAFMTCTLDQSATGRAGLCTRWDIIGSVWWPVGAVTHTEFASCVRQSLHSTLFQAGRQVFRCRSGIELPAAHSVSIFWPCYMYSKWFIVFIVTSIFKTRFCLLGLKVLHNLVRKSFEFFARIMLHIKVPTSRRIQFTSVFW